MLHSNQIRYFSSRLACCAEQARQVSLFSPVIAYGFIWKQEAFFRRPTSRRLRRIRPTGFAVVRTVRHRRLSASGVADSARLRQCRCGNGRAGGCLRGRCSGIAPAGSAGLRCRVRGGRSGCWCRAPTGRWRRAWGGSPGSRGWTTPRWLTWSGACRELVRSGRRCGWCRPGRCRGCQFSGRHAGCQ